MVVVVEKGNIDHMKEKVEVMQVLKDLTIHIQNIDIKTEIDIEIEIEINMIKEGREKVVIDLSHVKEKDVYTEIKTKTEIEIETGRGTEKEKDIDITKVITEMKRLMTMTGMSNVLTIYSRFQIKIKKKLCIINEVYLMGGLIELFAKNKKNELILLE